MSSESLIITVGASVGVAIAALGNVENKITRLGEASARLTSQQTRLGNAINNGTFSNQSIATLGRQYDGITAHIAKLDAIQNQLARRSERKANLRDERKNMRSEALDLIALGSSVVLPVKLAIDYESSMAEVRKVVDFESPAEFKKLGDDLLELGTRIPVPAAGLAQIAASGGQLGVKAKDIPKFTETIAKMSVAFDMLPDEAGDSMAKLANVYNIPIENIGNLGDAINQLSNESPAKARDIVQSLSRVGGVAKLFGLTEIQTASLTNAFVSLGKAPEVAGTAINGMLTKLMTADKQGKDFQAALTQIGYSATGLKQSIGKDAQGALVDFLGTLNKIPKEQRMGILVDLFGREYADDVAVLAGSPETYEKSRNTVKTKESYDGSMEREFKTRSETTANNILLLKGNLTQLGVTVGASVLPMINAVVNDMKPLVHGFASWIDNNKKLASSIFGVVTFLASMKIGMFAARYGVSLLKSGVNDLFLMRDKIKGGFFLFKAARLGDMSKTNALLQSIGISAERATLWSDKLGRAGNWTKNKTKAGLAKIGQGVRNAPAAIGGGVKRAAVGTFNLGKSVVMGGWNALGATVKAILHPINTLKAGIRGVGLVGRMAGVALRTAFRFALGAILSISWPVVAVIGVIAGAAFLIYKYWKPIRAFFGGIWQGVKEGLQPLAPLFHAIGAVAGKMFAPLRPVWNWLKGALGGIVGWFGKVLQQEEDVGGGARSMGVRVGHAIAAFINGAVRLATTVITKFGQVVDWFKALPAKFVEFGKNIMQGLLDGISGMFDKVVGKIKSVGSAVAGAFTSHPQIQVNSPSRAFKRFGGWVMEGLGIGIDGQSGSILGRIARLGTGMKKAFAPRLDTPTMAMRDAIERVKQGFGAGIHGGTAVSANKGVHVAFSPVIHVNGNGQGSTGVQEQVEKGLSMGLRELESMMKRIADEQLRKAF